MASPEGYAKAALRFVGYEARCTPYWPHALMGYVISSLPESVFESFNIKRCLQIRKKGMLKDSRKKEWKLSRVHDFLVQPTLGFLQVSV